MRWCGPFRKRASRFLLLDSLLQLFVRHTQAGFFALIEAAAQADLPVACDAVGADLRLRRILSADGGTNAGALGIAIGARFVRPVGSRVRGVAAHDLRIGAALMSGYACHRGLLSRDQGMQATSVPVVLKRARARAPRARDPDRRSALGG